VDFMGTDKDYLSLDALVPVWKKFKSTGFICNDRYTPARYSFTINQRHGYGYGVTIQEAALIATARAIDGLKK
jgi:hypothetical protein